MRIYLDDDPGIYYIGNIGTVSNETIFKDNDIVAQLGEYVQPDTIRGCQIAIVNFRFFDLSITGGDDFYKDIKSLSNYLTTTKKDIEKITYLYMNKYLQKYPDMLSTIIAHIYSHSYEQGKQKYRQELKEVFSNILE